MQCLPTLLGILMVGASGLLQQDPAQTPPMSQTLATVNGYAIKDAALIRWLGNKLPNFSSESAARPKLSQINPSLVKATLNYLVDRRIVFEYLSTQGLKIGADETKLELDALSTELEEVGQSLVDYLAKDGISQSELEFELQWELAWNRYSAKVLNDEYLEKHFMRDRRRFDGSEMRLAHLLIRVNDTRTEVEALKLAEKIYDDLSAVSFPMADRDETSPVVGKKPLPNPTVSDSDWAEAVLQHSQAPSRKDAGEIGWIHFHQPMPESFSRVAFGLQPGQISRPVVTSFGVHLIRCRELKEGKMGWRDSKDAVRDHAAKSLFEQIAKQHRSKVAVNIN